MAFQGESADLQSIVSKDIEDLRKLQLQVSMLADQLGVTVTSFASGLIHAEKTLQVGDIALTIASQTLVSQTFSLPAGGTVVITGSFNFVHTAAGAGVAEGSCFIDGSAELGVAKLNEAAVEATVAATWVALLAAGSHTVELTGLKTINAGAVVAQGTNSGLTVIGFGLSA